MLESRFALEVAFAAGLFDEADAADLDVVRQRLTHVVNGQGGDGGAGEGFHLYASAMVHGYLACYDDLAVARVVDFDCAVVNGQGVAEGDEVVCALGSHDARNDGGVEYRALLRAVAA